MGFGMEYSANGKRAPGRRAVFLDRDGTLVYPRHDPANPDELVVPETVIPPLRALQQAGFLLVLVTNQSCVACGHMTEDDLAVVHAELAERLNRDDVRLDAVYYCPHHPDGTIPRYAVDCDCRKPAPGMFLQAGADLCIDLSRSWCIGDILDDIEAGRRAGCRTVLVDLGTESLPADPRRSPDFVAADTEHALRIILVREGLMDPIVLDHRPNSWRWQTILSEAH